jgi:hypothetical protein
MGRFCQWRREDRRAERGIEDARRQTGEDALLDDRAHACGDPLEPHAREQTEKWVGGQPMLGAAEDRDVRRERPWRVLDKETDGPQEIGGARIVGASIPGHSRRKEGAYF